MARRVPPARLLPLALIILLVGCSTVEKELARADRYLVEKQHAAALVMYRNILPRLEVTDRDRIASTHTRISECLAALGRPAEAFAELQRALEVNPGSTEAHLQLGELFLATGNNARALQEAQLVLHVRPQDVDALTISGAAYASLANYEAAVAALARAFELAPTRDNVAIGLAELHARNGDPEAAREVLARSAQVQPHNPEPRLAQARLEESLGDTEAAERAYRAAIAAADTAETTLRLAQFLQRSSRIAEAEEILKKLDERQAGSSTLKADFEISSGRVFEAVQSYMAAMQRRWRPAAGKSAGVPSAVVARLVEAELELAKTQAEHSPAAAGEAIARARGHLDAHRAELDSATIAVLEAELALAEGDVTRARGQAQSAVAAAPTSASAHYVMGLAHYRSGDRIAAQESWLAAIEQNTDFVPALLAIASLSLEMGEPKSAEDFASAVVLDEPANLRALLLYARALAAQKRYPAAAGILARAAAVDPARPEPHIVAGEIALDRGHFAESLVSFQKAVLLDPQSHAAVDGITRLYEKGRITRPMLRKMESIASNPPASAALMEVVGRLYARRGWHGDAVRALERSLQVDAGRQSAATALVDAYLRTGRADRAAETALRNSAGPAQVLAAIRAQQMNDIDAAIQHYETAIRQGERTGFAANNLAWLYAQKGASLDRALHLARTAGEARPGEPAVADTLGMVHLKRREYTEAIASFRRAVELAQRNRHKGLETFRVHLAEAYRLAGQPDDAAAERAKSRGMQP